MFWKKKSPIIETTTLKKYTLVFETVDGKTHTNHYINYMDDNTISCSPLEYFLINHEDFLIDDEGNCYPVCNIISIKFVLEETIKNVKKIWFDKTFGISQIYYTPEMIEIVDKS